MTDRAPERVRLMMQECTDKIDQYIAKTLKTATDTMPDVEENKAIFIDSVIAGTLSQVMINRSCIMTPNERRKYVRTMLSHIKDVTHSYITKEELEELNDNSD